jgi:hypothetical protein
MFEDALYLFKLERGKSDSAQERFAAVAKRAAQRAAGVRPQVWWD